MSFEDDIKPKLVDAFHRLNLSFDVRQGWARLARKSRGLSLYRRAEIIFLIVLALVDLSIMGHSLLFKAFLVTAYGLLISVPFTAQLIVPGTPILAWLLTYYSSQFIDKHYRPHIWVSVLPTLESVLYGANVSDILTRYTTSLLDFLSWIPYGILHFALPFFVAAACFIFAPQGSTPFFGSAFGYLNLVGVLVQIFFPCAPPWYELRHGLIPANYDMGGSPGGLARIDALFHSSGYTVGFTNSPVVFGAFPSLHAGCSTMEALFLSHFFPEGTVVWWGYAFWLYWSTMYLTHHYLIDLVAGGSLAVFSFYFFMPRHLREVHPIEEYQTLDVPLKATYPSPSLPQDYELVDVRTIDEFQSELTVQTSSMPSTSAARARSSSTASKNARPSSSHGAPSTSSDTRSRSSSLTTATSYRPRGYTGSGLPPPTEDSDSPEESFNGSRPLHTRERSKSVASIPLHADSPSPKKSPKR